MSLGTISYDGKIYNLDYMTPEELEELLSTVEKEKQRIKREIKKKLK